MSNEVGIIYSPGFGAGWSTWGVADMALDQELAKAIESGDESDIIMVVNKDWPNKYLGGLDNCVVEWVEEGTEFYIDEYDGNESIVFKEDGDIWMKAEAK